MGGGGGRWDVGVKAEGGGCRDINNLIAVVYLNAAGAPSDGYF